MLLEPRETLELNVLTATEDKNQTQGVKYQVQDENAGILTAQTPALCASIDQHCYLKTNWSCEKWVWVEGVVVGGPEEDTILHN